MHEVVIKELRFWNFMSYGNNETSIKFTDAGLIWVRGLNGFGKSAIVEALTFGLYGSAYRKVNGGDKSLPIKKLKNTANDKVKMRVEIDFDRIDNKGRDEYTLARSMTGSGTTSCDITKNGETEKKVAGVFQKKLEEEILGFNKNLFENVISLNTVQSTPIIEMNPEKKRKLIESLLTLSLDKFKDLNNKKLKQSQIAFDNATSDVNKYNKDVIELTNIINQIEQEITDDINELEEQLNELVKSKDNKTNELTTIKNKIKTIQNDGVTKKESLKEYTNLDNDIESLNEVKMYIPSLNTDKERLLTLQNELTELSKKEVQLKSDLDKYNITELNSSIQNIENEIYNIINKKNELQNVINHNTSLMKKCENDAKSLVSGIPCKTCGKPSTDEDIELIKNNYRKEYKQYKELINNANNEIALLKSVDDLKIELQGIKDIVKLAEISKDNYNSFINSDLKLIKSQIITCRNEINTKEDKIKTIGYSDVSDIENKLSELLLKKDIKKKIEEEVQELRVEISSYIENEKSLTSSIVDLNTRINSLSEKISVKKDSNNIESLKSSKLKLQDVQDELTKSRFNVDKESDNISIYQYIQKMYSDDGVKQIILSIFIPNLNKAIAYNLTKFNLPYSIRFSESMDMEFSSRHGMADDYYGLSEGQKRKINFAIALSFRDFVSKIADFKINLLILDEVLDISTDDIAYREMVTLTKEKLSDIHNIMTITHRGYLTPELFDTLFEITFDGRYSFINQSKLN